MILGTLLVHTCTCIYMDSQVRINSLDYRYCDKFSCVGGQKLYELICKLIFRML